MSNVGLTLDVGDLPLTAANNLIKYNKVFAKQSGFTGICTRYARKVFADANGC
jgi:hypothetical protein